MPVVYQCSLFFETDEYSVSSRDNREEAKSKVLEAKQVLEQWKASYFERRTEIEKLGQAPRWEFDRKRLFERSDYMASVCQDLGRVFKVGIRKCIGKH